MYPNCFNTCKLGQYIVCIDYSEMESDLYLIDLNML